MPSPFPSRPSPVGAFSLIEIMLVVALLTLIMVALMSVFSTTQTAFRASVTQTDVLEGSRAAMDLITADFRQMVPSGGTDATNLVPTQPPFKLGVPPSYANVPTGPINFWISDSANTFTQQLVGSVSGYARTNFVQSVFILTYQNQVWRGIGYFVDTNSAAYLDPLYRYDSFQCTNLPPRPPPFLIFSNFSAALNLVSQPPGTTNFDYNPYGYVNHLLDGVLHFNVRAYDVGGILLTNGYGFNQSPTVVDTVFYPPTGGFGGEVPLFMCSNTVPAAVEIQMAVLEDRTLQRVSSIPLGKPRSDYIAQQAGKVHLFRQRVNIPNVDRTAYP